MCLIQIFNVSLLLNAEQLKTRVARIAGGDHIHLQDMNDNRNFRKLRENLILFSSTAYLT